MNPTHDAPEDACTNEVPENARPDAREERTCSVCPKTFTVSPGNRYGRDTCSVACRMAKYRARRRLPVNRRTAQRTIPTLAEAAATGATTLDEVWAHRERTEAGS